MSETPHGDLGLAKASPTFNAFVERELTNAVAPSS